MTTTMGAQHKKSYSFESNAFNTKAKDKAETKNLGFFVVIEISDRSDYINKSNESILI
jgi:hypothetical protein